MNKLYNISTIRILLLGVAFSFAVGAHAATNYNITSNKKWSAVMPASCTNCTISISRGVTLTIDENVTCQNCTFEGGNMVMTDHTLNIKYSGGSPVTAEFTGVKFDINGNNGKVIVNAPLSLTTSTFNFNDASSFTTSYDVDMVLSTVNLNDASSMISTGSSSVEINLSGLSKIAVGDGSQTSTASFTVSGPTMSVYDFSSLAIGNTNNAYSNWASYKTGFIKGWGTNNSYSTSTSAMNCGGTGQHACSNPTLFGPANLNTSGPVPGNTLPVILTGFTAAMNDDGNATLGWQTQMEQNSRQFEIERSSNGANWSVVGVAPAKGNSLLPTSYSYTDASPLQGANYYRLKMIDLDGSAVYSEVKVIQTAAATHLSFFPNPAREFVNVTLGGANSGVSTVRLINQAGAVMQEKKAQGGTTVTFSLQQCTTGFYILSVVSPDGTRQSSKLLINKN